MARMIYVSTDPNFDKSFADPTINPMIFSVAKHLASYTDDFVRQCVEKVLSPESLALFVDAKVEIPGLDLELLFFSPQKHRVRVFFQKREIGSAICTIFQEGDAMRATLTIEHL